MSTEDAVVRVHERLDTLNESIIAISIQLAEIRGATRQHADDMAFMREEFSKRDSRFQVTKEWAENEISRVNSALHKQELEVERDRSYVRGVWKVLGILGVGFLTLVGYVWNSVERVVDKMVSIDTTVIPEIKNIQVKQKALEDRLSTHERVMK